MESKASEHVSWTKILTLCASFGTPAISVAVWLIITGTKLSDKVDTVLSTLAVHSIRLDKIESNQEKMHETIDTITRRQERNDISRSYQINNLRNYYNVPKATSQQWRPVYYDKDKNYTFKKP